MGHWIYLWRSTSVCYFGQWKTLKSWSHPMRCILGTMAQAGALFNTHVKLLAFDLLSLTQNPSSSSFSRRGIHLSRAEAVGTVTSREFKPDRFLRFTLDDGTGCVHCILWLNQLSFTGVPISPDVALADLIQLGKVARVRGQITSFRGVVQITVSDIVIETDPNAEIFHWLDCLNLARKCYDVLPSKRN